MDNDRQYKFKDLSNYEFFKFALHCLASSSWNRVRMNNLVLKGIITYANV